MLIYDASLSTLRNLQHYWYLHGGGETHMCGQSLYRRRCLPWGGFFLESLCIIQANASGYLVFSPLFPSRPLLTSLICLFFFYQHYPPSSHCSSFHPLLSSAFYALVTHLTIFSICECSAKCTCAGLSQRYPEAILYFGPCYWLLDSVQWPPKTGCSF